jgi:hypothetical protein
VGRWSSTKPECGNECDVQALCTPSDPFHPQDLFLNSSPQLDPLPTLSTCMLFCRASLLPQPQVLPLVLCP